MRFSANWNFNNRVSAIARESVPEQFFKILIKHKGLNVRWLHQERELVESDRRSVQRQMKKACTRKRGETALLSVEMVKTISKHIKTKWYDFICPQQFVGFYYMQLPQSWPTLLNPQCDQRGRRWRPKMPRTHRIQTTQTSSWRQEKCATIELSTSGDVFELVKPNAPNKEK